MVRVSTSYSGSGRIDTIADYGSNSVRIHAESLVQFPATTSQPVS